MTRIRCPQERCIFNIDGWCDSDEIELDATTLACITFEEVDFEAFRVTPDTEDDELEWDEDEPLWEEDLDESLYEVEDDDEEEEDDELVEEDEEWR